MIMNELDQAYRTLDLSPGATLRQVVEARDELRTLWDPDRLARHPRLHAKAPGKIQEIERAYQILAAQLGRTDAVRPSPATGKTRLPPSTAPSETTSEKPSASLYDEVFSRGASPIGKRVPMWVLVTSVTAVGLLVAYFIPSSPPPDNRPDLSALYNAQEPLPESLPAGTPHSNPEQPGPEGPAEPPMASPAQTSPPPAPFPAAATGGSPPSRGVSASQPAPRQVPARPPDPLPRTARTKADSDKKDVPRPVLERGPTPPSGEEETESAPPQEVTKPSAEDREAYQNLLKYSPTARRLVEGGFQTLQFVEWKVVQQTPEEIWVDLVGRASAGEAIHFIWSVSLKESTARPLSQAARNLERRSQAD